MKFHLINFCNPKRIVSYFIVVAAFAYCCILLQSFKVYKNPEEKWELAWVENFNGNKLDTTVWGFRERSRDGGGKYMTSNPACYSIKNGELTIKGIFNNIDESDTASYLNGGITTRFKKSFAPGRIEVKAKFNSISGGHPAIWLMPFSKENGWPADGEIDIMEQGGLNDYITQTVHTSYTKANVKAPPTRYVKKAINFKDYNIYGVDILSDRIDFFVNHELTLSYPRIDTLASKGQFPFIRDWYIILNVSIGVKGTGRVCNNSLPIEMTVDWIKYYTKKH